MKVVCTVDIPYFTIGKVYNVTHIDEDGDIWVEEDDGGHRMFLYPDECETVTDECPHCNGSGYK